MMVTHDPEVAAQADRVVHIRDGLVDSEEAWACVLRRRAAGRAAAAPPTDAAEPDAAAGSRRRGSRTQASQERK